MKNRLKALRQTYQWSQSDVARELGISRQAVNGFESGKFDPSLDMAFRIAKLFNVSIEDVFVYQEKNPMQNLIERLTQYLFGSQKFTEKAVNAVEFARNEATRLKRSQVEPNHLLAGLLADPTTTAARLLRANGLTLSVETNDRSFQAQSGATSEFSLESKSALELAVEAVQLKGGQYVGTEHLLLGLVRLAETGNTALTDLFQQYEVDLQALTNQIAESV